VADGAGRVLQFEAALKLKKSALSETQMASVRFKSARQLLDRA
jgi:hypothetical protein